MNGPLITRHDLERRHAALQDLRRYLAEQERDFERQRLGLQAFAQRYQAAVGALYQELDALEAQLQRSTEALLGSLLRQGIELGLPEAGPLTAGRLPEAQRPRMAQLARLEGLPPATALPPVPVGVDIAQWAPPTLKMLYRRAAMRIHPDRAANDAERREREQLMMAVNAAYAAGERWRLEAMLVAAGEDVLKVCGGQAQALRNWLAHCENLVQQRLRLVNDYLEALSGTGMYRLWRSVEQAEARGLDPLATMVMQLRAQVVERRKELYISARLKPDSSLARAFLHQRVGRQSGAPSRTGSC
ncbi:MAG: J domain-containing protein [Roseateles asaccharophilus]|uniref:J domain-containing protein n=1 Tax=Roseateles asaccharophilus TaxID=582607 RepID=A0A4R6N8J3_9BURK|nr:J domain-containing protein [Roseateles asaccharophilus]MDN3545146.1 J domain-containing protein [Roseateles asaccharophilus]TDP11467.1 hypothetical protein DFR39_103398 [Roseateles asaccharophilus]